MANNEANLKGKFLEKIVGLLHEIGGSEVDLNTRLPSVDGTSRKREIDVLIKVSSAELDDCPVLIPIECKNYGDQIGVDLIDAFVGKLLDIGINTNLGIFVAATGFTKGAIQRAKAAGIKTLIAEGLDAKRLALKIEDVLHSVVFWVAKWVSTNHFPYIPSSSTPDGMIEGKLPAGLSPQAIVTTGPFGVIWQLWMQGKIPNVIGVHTIYIAIGPNEALVCDVEVSAHGACIPAQKQSVALVKTDDGEAERQHTEVSLNFGKDAFKLIRFADV